MRRRPTVGVVDREVAYAAGVAAALPTDEFETVILDRRSGSRRGAWNVVLIDERLVRDDDSPIDEGGASVGVIVEHPSSAAARGLLRRGARAVIPRDARVDEVHAAASGLAAGEIVLPADLLSGLIESSGSRRRRIVRIEGRELSLTPRQAEVVELHERGLSTGEIARTLSISVVTVRRHLGDARRAVGRRGAE